MLLTIATRTCDPDILVFELAGRISLGRESSHLEDTVLKAIADGHHKIVVVYRQIANGCDGQIQLKGLPVGAVV